MEENKLDRRYKDVEKTRIRNDKYKSLRKRGIKDSREFQKEVKNKVQRYYLFRTLKHQ